MFEGSKLWSRWGAHLGARERAFVALIVATVTLSGCATAAPERDAGATDAPLRIYATTGYLADAVHQLAPEAEVTTMVGPGGDPHTHQPSTRDIERILDADLVVWNGLGLEAQMEDQLRSLGERQLAAAETLSRAQLIPLDAVAPDGEPLVDPHVWNDPAVWADVVRAIAGRLGDIDPGDAETYRQRAESYADELARASDRAQERLRAVPEPRVLVTGHDAFAYFGRTFDLDVHATDVISTEADLSATEIDELARLIAGHRVPVIFTDNQANPQAIVSLREAVRARGFEVHLSRDDLYADALGAEAGVDTTLGVLAHNATVIADALAATKDTP